MKPMNDEIVATREAAAPPERRGGLGACDRRPEGAQTGFARHGGPGGIEAGFSASWYWQQILRQWPKIVVMVLVGTLLTAIYVVRIPKQYESTATIRIDADQRTATADASSQAATEGPNYDSLIVTELNEAQSRSVILEAFHAYALDRDPIMHAAVEQILAKSPVRRVADDNDYYGLIAASLSVEHPGGSRTIEVHFRSISPDTAANVANAIANALINHEYETRMAAMAHATDFLSRQLSELRARVEQTGQALVNYEASHDILNPDDHQENVMNQRLLQLSTDLTQVQSERIKEAATLEVARTGTPEALLATDAAQFLRPAYQAWQNAEAEFERTRAEVGAADPLYQQARARVQAAQVVLDAAQKQLLGQLTSNFNRATERERMVTQAVAAARTDMDNYNARAVEYNLLKRDADSAQAIYQSMYQKVQENNVLQGFRGRDLRITDPAVPNRRPVYPRVLLSALAAFLLTMLLSCGAAIAVAVADRAITTPEDVEERLGVRFLGGLPAVSNAQSLRELMQASKPGLQASSAGQSGFLEALYTLRTAILFAAEPGIRTISVVSARPGEGKSTLAANLAMAFARHGARVLLVDADIRRPSIHRLFQVPNRYGLTSLLQGNVERSEAMIPSLLPMLSLLPAGPGVDAPAELLSMRLDETLEEVKPHFDIIVVDTPPLLGFVDALAISSLMDGVILVTQAGRIVREEVNYAIGQLERVRARFLGVVLNRVQSSRNPYYASYGYSKYYQATSKEGKDGEDEWDTPEETRESD